MNTRNRRFRDAKSRIYGDSRTVRDFTDLAISRGSTDFTDFYGCCGFCGSHRIPRSLPLYRVVRFPRDFTELTGSDGLLRIFTDSQYFTEFTDSHRLQGMLRITCTFLRFDRIQRILRISIIIIVMTLTVIAKCTRERRRTCEERMSRHEGRRASEKTELLISGGVQVQCLAATGNFNIVWEAREPPENCKRTTNSHRF